MSRSARVHAESGLYHVMLRGINHQQIFVDEEDNLTFLQILKDYKAVCGYKLLAYCLMGNHVHLLMKEGSESLEKTFKRIGAKYVYWYNAKYQRIGHLFQDRFKSEVVETEQYLCSVIRYIHQNPIKAGICKKPEEYLYSSFSEYCGNPGLVDFEYVEKYVTIPAVVKMSSEYMTEECMDIRDAPIKRVTDQQAIQLIRETTGCDDPSVFQLLANASREAYIQKLKTDGLSIRQISRLTGLTYYAIQKINR